MNSSVSEFELHRRHLFAIAYRMLGTVVDAEDAVQEAFLRWQQSDRSQVENSRAFLSTTVTRLCIDRLRSARTAREKYVGPWLPEPICGCSSEPDSAELAESLSIAFLVALETLSPVERAAFLLRDVFQYDFDQIADIVGKSSANCRQIVSRARRNLKKRRRREPADRKRADELTDAFLSACRNGDLEELVSLLSEDVTLCSDGGGQVPSALRPISGTQNVARFLLGIMNKAPDGLAIHRCAVNGQPGIVASLQESPVSVLTTDCDDRQISAVYIINNPGKLVRILKEAFTNLRTENERAPHDENHDHN